VFPCLTLQAYYIKLFVDSVSRKELINFLFDFWRFAQMQEDKANNNLCNVREYDSSIIANRIKRECLKRDIVLKVMLSDLKMNINTISAMCNKGQMPAADRLARIADYIGVSVDYLLGRVDRPE
jgi:hypothetical protein